ncbi:hypothetical protein NE237_019692 [Protea cynaroides]|uniref:TPX2 C-terminal domain-containing protein n=1 Tax=Protea cynaroides TaxID=273540 RepID=A0A9Q0H4M4_9MAGN|nr:hypothetical protein NE237_019692 [Protea cynaroides]
MEESKFHTSTLRDENEREESVSSKTALEVSVSFGRFENELLSWEKWSSFSQNKYLEEVEKCSTPGSVASKKAYFEAHYKKIPTRIAGDQGREVRMQVHTLGSDEAISGDLISNGCEFNAESSPAITDARKPKTNSLSLVSNSNTDESNNGYEFNVESSPAITDAMETKINSLSLVNSSNTNELNNGCEFNAESTPAITDAREPKTNPLSLVSSYNSDESNKEAEVTDSNKEAALDVDGQVSFDEELKEELEGRFDPKSNTLDIGILEEENTPMESQATMELLQQLDNGAVNTQENKVEDSKLKPPKESQKRTPATKKKSLTRIKNSPASPTPKSRQFSIPGSSKPRLASAVMSITQSPATKGSRSSLQTSRNLSTVESRRSTATSLTKSLALQPENSNSASRTTTRKSFIMENMGDKEIVKRAFKAFQYSFNQLRPTTETEPSAAEQVSTKVKGQTKTALMTRQKDMERTRNAGENARAPRMQMGARQNAVSVRPSKTASVDHLHFAPSSPFSLKSSERAEKRKEFFKKLVEKSNATEVKKMQLQSKSKEEKDAEIRKLRQSLNFKATPLPDFYGGQVSKSLVK